MSREHFIQWYRLDSNDFYLVWYEDEKDGVIVDETGFVPIFHSIEAMKKYFEHRNIRVDVDDPSCLDLDHVQSLLENGHFDTNGYNSILNAWNLFGDVSLSTDGNFDSERESTNGVYDKIFWGCNLPAMTPEGQSFEPEWSTEELTTMKDILTFGVEMLREKTTLQ